MTKDNRKTKAQLIDELSSVRQELESVQVHIANQTDNKLGTNHIVEDLEHAGESAALIEAKYLALTELHGTLQYDEVLDRLLDQLKFIIPHDAACIILIHGESARVFRWNGYARFGTGPLINPSISNLDDMESLQAMQRTGQPYVVSDVPVKDEWITRLGLTWIKSYMSAPIRVRGQVIGYLHVDSAKPGFFKQQDAETLRLFLDHAVGAIENAWLYNRARLEIVNRVKDLKQEQSFISAILETSSALVYVLDPTGHIIRVNRAFEQVFGYALNDILNKPIWGLFAKGEDADVLQHIFAQLIIDQTPYEYEHQWTTHDGTPRIIMWTSTVLLDQDGSAKYIISTGFDITSRKEIEAALHQSQERYSLAALATNDGLWDWDLDTDEMFYSERWKDMLGYKNNEISSSPDEWFSRVHPKDLAELKRALETFQDDRNARLSSEYRIRHKDGEYRWVLAKWLAVRNGQMKPRRLTGSQSDITQQKATMEKLWHSSLHDALTGLPNRTLFMKRMEKSIEQANEQENHLFAVLFLDLDRFKVINDSLGHLVGDQLLITIAQRLTDCLRPGDTVARFGGDEFALLIENIQDAEDAISIAQRIQQELTQPITLAGQEVVTSASIGIALSSTGYHFPEDMLRDADTTMYKAKSQGKDRYEMFEHGLHMQALETWEMEAELRQAIEQREFEVFYQPLVSLATGEITGVEALLRWQHPQRGLILPKKFIPLAEETGLVAPIGEWVLRTACAQAKAWHNMGHDRLRVSVNVSYRQFQQSSGQPDLPHIIMDILADTGLSPKSLELEITESIPLSALEASAAVLKRLKTLNIQIALDDFGISSSLTCLKSFPIDTLKIDQSFVKDLTRNPDDAAIIQAIVTMARGLNLRIIAEGVETQGHLTFLQTLQCDEIQGWLFSRPVAARELTQMLQSGKRLAQ